MEQATKDKIAVVGKEALKIGIAVAAGVAAYKLYENYKTSQVVGSLDCGSAAVPTESEYADICKMF